MSLPLRIERAIADSQALRTRLAAEFDLYARTRASDARSTLMCTKGCAFCCWHPTRASVLEGVPLYRHLVRAGLWTTALRKAVQAHSEKTFGLAPQVWLLSMLACPLLDPKANVCLSYANRPFVCRVMYSVGDPQMCHPHKILQAVGMVNQTAALAAFVKGENALFRANGAHNIPLPVSTALLLAERLVKGEVDFEQLDQHLLKESLAL